MIKGGAKNCSIVHKSQKKFHIDENGNKGRS
jgi:hypothetical protein